MINLLPESVIRIFTAADLWPLLIDTVCRSKLGFGGGFFVAVCFFVCFVVGFLSVQGDQNRKKIHPACMTLQP